MSATNNIMDLSMKKSTPSLIKQGAEAKIYKTNYFGKSAIVKERFSKKYRHPVLDEALCKERTKSEIRALLRCSTIGISTPTIYFVDMSKCSIWMEYLTDSITVKDYIINQGDDSETNTTNPQLVQLAEAIGKTVAKMHNHRIIHGDLTTSNILTRNYDTGPTVLLIDFGLGYVDSSPEDKGVDLYVLEKAYVSTHPKSTWFLDRILQAYFSDCANSAEVLKKLEEIRLRGRKRTMVG